MESLMNRAFAQIYLFCSVLTLLLGCRTRPDSSSSVETFNDDKTPEQLIQDLGADKFQVRALATKQLKVRMNAKHEATYQALVQHWTDSNTERQDRVREILGPAFSAESFLAALRQEFAKRARAQFATDIHAVFVAASVQVYKSVQPFQSFMEKYLNAVNTKSNLDRAESDLVNSLFAKSSFRVSKIAKVDALRGQIYMEANLKNGTRNQNWILTFNEHQPSMTVSSSEIFGSIEVKPSSILTFHQTKQSKIDSDDVLKCEIGGWMRCDDWMLSCGNGKQLRKQIEKFFPSETFEQNFALWSQQVPAGMSIVPDILPVIYEDLKSMGRCR